MGCTVAETNELSRQATLAHVRVSERHYIRHYPRFYTHAMLTAPRFFTHAIFTARKFYTHTMFTAPQFYNDIIFTAPRFHSDTIFYGNTILQLHHFTPRFYRDSIFTAPVLCGMPYVYFMPCMRHAIVNLYFMPNAACRLHPNMPYAYIQGGPKVGLHLVGMHFTFF